MMYRMKNIILHDNELELPYCMYYVKNIFEFNKPNEIVNESDTRVDLKISEQVTKFLKTSGVKMGELEERQEQLLRKLDQLYEKIKQIGSNCNLNETVVKQREASKTSMAAPDEVVITTSPDNLPWYLHPLLRKENTVNVVWHIHSSVPKEKVLKINAFVKGFGNVTNGSKINLRLIFTNVSADAELKLSSLALPIVGDVNILRYLSLVYPNIYPSQEDFAMDSLLDLCYLLQKSKDKTKETIATKLFSQYNGWIYNKQFSIVDIAAYNVIKQLRNCPKYIPSDWFKKCEQFI